MNMLSRLGVGLLRRLIKKQTAPQLVNNNSDIQVIFMDQPAPELINNNSDITVIFKEV